MNELELKQRTKQFALDIMDLTDELPRNTKGAVIGRQLIRSATSIGANYRAVCRAKSPADFIAKLGVVEEEADESAYWLELIVDGRLLRQARIAQLLQEANELVAIMVSSRRTVIARSKSKSGA